MTERANAVTPNRRKPWLTLKMREMMEAWLFVSPTFIGFLIFFLGPLFAVMYYSLTEWNLLTQQAAFVGVANYENALLDNPDFWLVVRNSVIFAIGLVQGISPPLRWAILPSLDEKFLLQGEGGFINQILATVGVTGPNWLREPNWAMAAVIVTRVIKMVGLNMILYLAALQAIPRDYEDAARLEGASRRQIFAMVTWPLLAPTTLVIMVITTIGSFKVFDHIYQMTGGGPENGTLVLAFYIYQQGFKFFNIGYASALAMIMFVIVMALTLVQVMLRRKGAQ